MTRFSFRGIGSSSRHNLACYPCLLRTGAPYPLTETESRVRSFRTSGPIWNLVIVSWGLGFGLRAVVNDEAMP